MAKKPKKKGPARPQGPSRRELALERRLAQEAEHRMRVARELREQMIAERVAIVARDTKAIWVRGPDNGLRRLENQEFPAYWRELAIDQLRDEGRLPIGRWAVDQEIERRRAAKREAKARQ